MREAVLARFLTLGIAKREKGQTLRLSTVEAVNLSTVPIKVLELSNMRAPHRVFETVWGVVVFRERKGVIFFARP